MRIRSLLLPAVVIALALCLVACSDDDDPVAPPKLGTDPALLPGTWNLTGIRSESTQGTFVVPPAEIAEDPLIYDLFADGTGETYYKGYTSDFLWSADGSTLTVYWGGDTEVYEFGVSRTTLQLEFDVSDKVVYHITHTFTRLVDGK